VVNLQGRPAQLSQLRGGDAAALAGLVIMVQPLLALALPCC